MTADERDHHAEIVKVEAPPPTLFGTSNPAEIVKAATEQANVLKAVIEENELFTNIQGRRHVQVQGWTFLGSMVGVYPITVWTRRLTLEKDGLEGWEARVEARTRAGEVVGSSEGMCTRDEVSGNAQPWFDKPEYALRSMAQTRATSKALRQPLDFIMQLAGFDSTPAEEVPAGGYRPNGTSGGQKYICPECGQPEVVAVNSSNEKAPKWKCENKDCDGGKEGRSWASWHEHPPAAADGTVTPTLQRILTALADSEVTKAKLLTTARDAAKAAGADLPRSTDDIPSLSAEVVEAILTALGLEVIEEAEVVGEDAPDADQRAATGTTW